MLRPPSISLALLCWFLVTIAHAGEPVKVDRQPLLAQVKRVQEALDLLGTPLSRQDKEALAAASKEPDDAKAVAAVQAVLDRLCLAHVRIQNNQKMTVRAGAAKPALAEQGWRTFLVRVENPKGIADVELRADSPNALPLFRRSTSKPDPTVIPVGEVGKRFLEVMMFNTQPLLPALSGLELEYRILQIYSRDAGRKVGHLSFSLNKAKKSLARTDEEQYLFEMAPAVLVKLRLRDQDGQPTMGSFVFRDERGRVYPSLSRRLAPDFGFHPQVYRRDGETIALQPGTYSVTYTRGPEYLVLKRQITIPAAATHTETFDLKRWVHPAKTGWYSGDHHIHAAGCAHYESPTEGVTPEDMMRHVLGEDLNVGICLSWGPCWYHQKRYFEAKTAKHKTSPVNPLSTPQHLLRYDVEVSGFPSSHCGHICLLRLKEQDYPGARVIEDWPSWDLPIFKWAKAQGAVIGFAHSGWGLEVKGNDLPNYNVPRMDGIGANEYVVDVTHDLCDFISTVDTPAVWELNMWYHTLNCGYRCRISGETDFPCIYGERVGLGRSYVHLDGKLNIDDWVDGIKAGRCYVSDGKSHLMDFTLNGAAVGANGSEVKFAKPGTVQVKARVAALLEPEPTAETERVRTAPLSARPYWDLERARIGPTRTVPVEVVVNGKAVAKKEMPADGKEREVAFDVEIPQSAWVCLRIFPSSHTNPVFVVVDGKAIRASKKSADWCLKAIDNCWKQKWPRIRPAERAAAEAAFEHARQEYRRIRDECLAD
jgi:hypothetical protein